MKKILKVVLFLAGFIIGGAMVSSAAPYSATVKVLDATVKDKVIKDADIVFQKVGQTSVKAKTNGEGNASVSVPFDKDDENITMIISKQGYSSLVVKCPCNGLTYAISPAMKKQLDGMRIVLNWGQNPMDLDSHLVYPDNHVFFSKKTGTMANLDVDDTDGFGPETITIEKKFEGQKYVYSVHDFTNRERSAPTALSDDSNAKVFVYIGETLIKTYYVPKGQTGNLWTLFYIDEQGEFHDVNKFGMAANSATVRTQSLKLAETEAVVTVTSDNSKTSKQLNTAGEKAYHAKKYEEAVGLYQQAIEQDPNHAQAYSNLGLAFQKMNRSAEAIWANRKALALAKTKNVKASSYYNIARIYESEGKFEEALQYYKQADQNRPADTYKTAITRMNEKLGR